MSARWTHWLGSPATRTRLVLEGLEDRTTPATIQAVSAVDPFLRETTGNAASWAGTDRMISGDGRYVVFESQASNLGPTPNPGGYSDVFVRDLVSGITQRVNTNASGLPANSNSASPTISANGRYVAFRSFANNLVAGDTNGQWDVFVKDLQTGGVVRASTATGGGQSNGESNSASLSADGQRVVFVSLASNLVANDTNGVADVFVKDLGTGTLVRASTDVLGNEANGLSNEPAISGDGSRVAFRSQANNLVPNDTNFDDIFVKDLATGAVVRASTDASGGQANHHSNSPSLSADGTKVAFYTAASNLVPGDTNGFTDVYVKDVVSGAVTRASLTASGVQANQHCYIPSLSADGTKVSFTSNATNLVANDTNASYDVFVKDLQTGGLVRANTTSSGGQSSGPLYFATSLAADGNSVIFSTYDSSLAADNNGVWDVFRKNLQTGATTTVSARSSATGDGGSSTSQFSVSANGRYVAFVSSAYNLVPGDTNNTQDVFVRDTFTGVTQRVSTSGTGGQANGGSGDPAISADGRYVSFRSVASNLVANDTNGTDDLFVKDLQTGAIVRVSTDASGGQANSYSFAPSLSADGRYVAFYSYATNLVTGDTNNAYDVFVKDLQTGAVVRASTDASGGQGTLTSHSFNPHLSSDGRAVAFTSYASNLVPGDTNGTADVFVKDLQTGVVTLASSATNGVQANSYSDWASLSANGRYLSFASYASNLVSGDTNGGYDVFVKDLQTGAVERVSTSSAGVQGNSTSYVPTISADGRFVVFVSAANNLVAGDTNSVTDVFLKDRQTGTLTRLSTDATGTQGNSNSDGPSISADGRSVVFYSNATNLVPDDTNIAGDVFIWSDGNRAPTDVTLSNSSVAENLPVGTVVGTLAAVDPDAGDTHTFTLVDDAGGRFTLVGNQLRTNAVFDYEAGSSYTVRVRATDAAGLWVEKSFTITVTNVNEAPGVIVGGPFVITEGQSLSLSASGSDPDGDLLTYSWDVNGDGVYTDAFGAAPTLTWAQLVALGVNDGPYSGIVRVRVSDGSLTATAVGSLAVTNAPPAAAPNAFATDEDTLLSVGNVLANDTDPAGAADPLVVIGYSAGSALGAAVVVNPDGTFTYDPTAVAAFQALKPGQFLTDTFTYKVSDGDGGTSTGTVTITVDGRNDAPTVSGGPFAIPENRPNGSVVGAVSGADVDGDALTFSIVGGNTGGAFAVNPLTGQITVANAMALNFETDPVFTLTVRADDGATFTDAVVTINLSNVYEIFAFDVQRGQTQRSFVRYQDLTFAESGGVLSGLATDPSRFKLTRYDLAGANGANVNLAGLVSVAGNVLTVDFGPQGVGGDRNGKAGDGYYRFEIDTDGDGTFDTSRSFYRLLGDVNGDRTVNATDANLILTAFGTTTPERDANGDGVVNAADRTLAIRSLGGSLAGGLTLDD